MLKKLIFWWGRGKVEKIIRTLDHAVCYGDKAKSRQMGALRSEEEADRLNRVFRKDLTEMVTVEKRLEGTIRGSHADIL